MLDDIHLQLLYNHYEDTFSNIKESIKLRDKLMIVVLVLLSFFAVCTFWPTDAITTFSSFITQNTGAVLNIGTNFLGSIVWFGLLASIVRYLQVVIYIERQYVYIHKLEDELSKNYSNNVIFTREGKTYLKKYPFFSDWTCFLYTKIFPTILIVIIVSKIISEWIFYKNNPLPNLLFNSIIGICILISLILYIIFMQKQND